MNQMNINKGKNIELNNLQNRVGIFQDNANEPIEDRYAAYELKNLCYGKKCDTSENIRKNIRFGGFRKENHIEKIINYYYES
jgi:hypothetical protein